MATCTYPTIVADGRGTIGDPFTYTTYYTNQSPAPSIHITDDGHFWVFIGGGGASGNEWVYGNFLEAYPGSDLDAALFAGFGTSPTFANIPESVGVGGYNYPAWWDLGPGDSLFVTQYAEFPGTELVLIELDTSMAGSVVVADMAALATNLPPTGAIAWNDAENLWYFIDAESLYTADTTWATITEVAGGPEWYGDGVLDGVYVDATGVVYVHNTGDQIMLYPGSDAPKYYANSPNIFNCNRHPESGLVDRQNDLRLLTTWTGSDIDTEAYTCNDYHHTSPDGTLVYSVNDTTDAYGSYNEIRTILGVTGLMLNRLALAP